MVFFSSAQQFPAPVVVGSMWSKSTIANPVSLTTCFCALPPLNTHGTANSMLSFFSESSRCCR